MTKKSGVAHSRANHPLFPVPYDAQEADFESRDIFWIYVYRGLEVATKKWRYDELTDEEQICEQYGGGHYTLKARDEGKARWTASREIRLPGPSKPLNEVATPEPITTVSAPTADVSSPALRDALAVAAVVGPMLLQLMEASARRSEAQTNLLIQIVGKQNGGQSDAVTTALLQAALNRNPGQESLGLLQQGMQLGMQIGTRDEEGGDTVSQFVEGMGQLVELEKLKAAQRQPQPTKPPQTGGGGQ